MKITSLTAQLKDANRVNVLVDGKFRFSLDLAQVSELGIKSGKTYSEVEITEFEKESGFGKLYVKALDYCLIRYRSQREINDYLKRKVYASRLKSNQYDDNMASRVLERLIAKGYVDDQRFARYWVENRFQKKGVSRRRLSLELAKKGVSRELIDEVLSETVRSDKDEIIKVINKKRNRYKDNDKLKAYLIRQGFDYDLIQDSLDC